MEKKYLDRREAAEYLSARGLRFSHNTLSKLATVGGGPSYRKFGVRVVYTREDLDAWIEHKLSPPRASAAHAPAPV